MTETWRQHRQNVTNMPQIRYFHRGRYFRPSKPLHFLPPIKLNTGATQHSVLPSHETAWQKTNTRWRGTREKKHSRYRKMVVSLASYLTMGNVSDMKFLCRDHVRPPQIVDEVTNARHLLALLENQRLLAENSLYFLQTLLYYIARPDLYQIVLDFRADRQENYVDRGVDISEDYKVDLEEDCQRLDLANELLKFRKDLKPRRRLNQIDVSEMRRKLNELSSRMQENINIMQHPNAPKLGLGDNDSSLDPHGGDGVLRQDNNIQITNKENLTLGAGSMDKTPATKPLQEHTKTSEGQEKRTPPNDIVQKGNISNRNKPDSHETAENDTVPVHADSKTTYCLKESTEEDYFTEDEMEISEENFGYETPCPPPREMVLGINGVKVYDDVNSANPVTARGVKTAHRYPPLTDWATGKIHELHRLSRDHRSNSKRRVQKRKQKPKTKTSGSVDKEPLEETSNTKDQLKLPDIYDRYARHTAVHITDAINTRL